jgi:hypothetical protein
MARDDGLELEVTLHGQSGHLGAHRKPIANRHHGDGRLMDFGNEAHVAEDILGLKQEWPDRGFDSIRALDAHKMASFDHLEL